MRLKLDNSCPKIWRIVIVRGTLTPLTIANTFVATVSKIANIKKKTVDKINCYYFGGSYYLKDINHLKLCEPENDTIK